MKPVKLQQYSCISCPSRKFHCGNAELHDGVMLHSGEHYCMGKKKPRKFKKSEVKKAPPTWCPKRNSNVELLVYDFVEEHRRQMFAFFYDHCGAIGADSHQYHVVSRHTIPFTAQDFWTSDQKDELLGEIQVPDFAVIAIDDGLRLQYFFKERDTYTYQPYLRTAPVKEGDV